WKPNAAGFPTLAWAGITSTLPLTALTIATGSPATAGRAQGAARRIRARAERRDRRPIGNLQCLKGSAADGGSEGLEARPAPPSRATLPSMGIGRPIPPNGTGTGSLKPRAPPARRPTALDRIRRKPRPRRTTLVGGAALLVLFAASAAAHAKDTPESWSRTFEVTRQPAVRIRADGASVTVHSWKESRVTVHVEELGHTTGLVLGRHHPEVEIGK